MVRVRTPTVLQMEAVECGAASLAIVLGYYRKFVPLEELRVACDVSRDGSKAKNVVVAARQYGLKAQGFRYEVAELKEQPTPFIVFWNFNHFLVVEGFQKDRVFLNDPGKGPRTVSLEEFSQSYTGVSLMMSPGADFKPSGSPPSLMASLRVRGKGSESALSFVTLISLLLVLPGLVLPGLVRIFIDVCLTEGRIDWRLPVLTGIAFTALARTALTWLQQSYLLRLETRLALAGSSRFFWHVLRLPMEFFSQRFGGEIGFRVGLNDRVAQLLSGQLATAALNTQMVVFFGLLMVLVNPWLAGIAIGFGALNMVALNLVSRTRKDASQRMQAERGQLVGTAMGGLQMIETLKASGGEDDLFSRWAGYQANLVESQQQLFLTTQYLASVPPFLRMLSAATVLTVGGLQVMHGALSIGSLVAFQSLAASFAQPIDRLVDQFALLQEAAGDMRRLDDVMHAEAMPGRSEMPAVGHLSGHLRIEEVSFGYSRTSPALIDKFSCELKPGARVAIVGDTGSGKSTLAKLVTGLLEPWEGSILIDGQPLRSLAPALLTQTVSMVDEGLFLFAGTVRENLTMWNSAVTDEQLTAAAHDACILDEILARPGGFDSPVTEGGSNFSGGQRQRLEIARSLVCNPALLVLDEATSALDPHIEHLVDQNLRRRGCSCLIVAHRLSTIRDCEEIVVLERGKVVQRGLHEELMAVPGAYASLIQSAAPNEIPDEDLRTFDLTPTASDSLTESTVVRRLASLGGLREKLTDGLTALPVGANRPIRLSSGSFWLLMLGSADVFYADGRRQFLYSVPPGGLVAGATDLMLTGQSDSEIYEIRPERLAELAGKASYQPALATLLDGWATSVIRAFRRLWLRFFQPEEHPGVTFVPLSAGTIELAAGALGRGIRPVLWVRVLSGELQLWGQVTVTGLIPITPDCWLKAQTACQLEIVPSGEAIAGGILESVLAFHQLLAKMAARSSELQAERSTGRLKSLIETDQGLFRSAQRELARVLTPEASGLGQGGGVGQVFLACQALEPALGITMKKPHLEESVTDPQSIDFAVRSVARVSNVRIRKVSLMGSWWSKANQPIVAVFKDGNLYKPVAILNRMLVDESGRRPLDASLAANIQANALAFYRPLPLRPLTGVDLLRFALVPCRTDLLRTLGTGLVVGLLGLVLPVLTGTVFGWIVPGGLRVELVEVATALLVVALSSGFLQMASNVALLRLEMTLDSSLQAAVWDRILRLPAAFFRRYTAGELTMRAMGISMMVQLLVGAPLRGLLGGVFSLCGFAVLFALNARLAFLVLLMALTGMLFTFVCGVALLRLQRQIAAAQGRISGLVLQLITGLARVRVAGAEARAFWLWAGGFSAQRRLQYRARRITNALTTFQGAYPVLATFVLFQFVSFGAMPPAQFLAFFAAFGQVFLGMGEIAAAVVPMLAAFPNYERTRPIFDAVPEVSANRVHPGSLSGAVSLSHVSFRYQADGPLVLDDVSIQVAPGEFVAIVGPSGAGKSSLCRLLLGFETPHLGAVSYDGQDLANLDVSAVRHEIGVVLQNGQLARGPVLSTIIGSSALTMDDAWEAAKLAGVDEDIKRMPMGMMTYVGEGAPTFSGGQKQRLLIARAIAQRPRIVLLDEATSGLDNRSQEIVCASLQRLRASRIVIAHRLSTIAGADRIYVLQDGKVVQVGKYDELLQQEGTFRKLALRQLV